jgi:rhodanese-related sulfurtransferase
MIARLMGLKTVSPEALQRMLEEGDVTVVDVNSAASWQQAHVPGALNVDPATCDERSLPPDHHASIVFYCSNAMCRKAPKVARRARKLGYTNVSVMSAGISGWLARRLPTVSVD